MHKTPVFLSGFRPTFAALFVLNCWLRKFALFAVASSFEVQFQSKEADAIVLQNLPLFVLAVYQAIL